MGYGKSETEWQGYLLAQAGDELFHASGSAPAHQLRHFNSFRDVLGLSSGFQG